LEKQASTFLKGIVESQKADAQKVEQEANEKAQADKAADKELFISEMLRAQNAVQENVATEAVAELDTVAANAQKMEAATTELPDDEEIQNGYSFTPSSQATSYCQF
jgi:hypothetical protein